MVDKIRRKRLRVQTIFFCGLLIALLNSDFLMTMLKDGLGFGRAFADSGARLIKLYGFSEDEIFGRKELDELVAKGRQEAISVLDAAEKESVIVVGEVSYPGQYELKVPVTAVSAILAAGGPSSYGSFRQIKVYRDNFCREYDLYDFLHKKNDDSPVLSGGETIVVLDNKNLIKVSGDVQKPGVYELKPGEMNLKVILDWAEGFASEKVNLVEIFRIFSGKRKKVLDCQFDSESEFAAFAQFVLEPGDHVVFGIVSGLVEEEVLLSGPFRNAGTVSVKGGARLSDFVSLRNLLPGYSEEYGEILRVADGSEEYEVVSFSPARILAGEADADMALRNGDRVVVFSVESFAKMAKVAIEQGFGGKQLFGWEKGQRVSDLISFAGGLEKTSGDVAELIRKQINNGRLETKSIIVDLVKVASGDPRYDLVLEPFDLLIVSKKK